MFRGQSWRSWWPSRWLPERPSLLSAARIETGPALQPQLHRHHRRPIHPTTAETDNTPSTVTGKRRWQSGQPRRGGGGQAGAERGEHRHQREDSGAAVRGEGSGVIYTADGMIITNNHVVTDELGDPVGSMEVTLTTGEKLPATIVGRDPLTDLAVIKVEADMELPMATFITDLPAWGSTP